MCGSRISMWLTRKALGSNLQCASQPSPAAGVVIAGWLQAAVEVPPTTRESAVQAWPSSQAVGQAPGWPAAIAVSHDSPASTTPLPQPGGQSGSELMSAPGGQQPSPA